MAEVTVIAVGKLKEKYLSDAIEEYSKRISKYAHLEIIELNEVRIQNESDKSEVASALLREGEKILSKIPKGASVAALCIEGKSYSSEDLAALTERELDKTGKLVYIIGSSHGLSDAVKGRADVRLSFSAMTFPHQLMRVMLLEAIYRSFTIINGAKYHK